MAKGSPFTTFTGRVGQMVGYIIRNSTDGQNQGLRAYQPNVSNPQTIQQANQRLVLKPLNNMLKQISKVVERAFEGTRYGAPSRYRFLSVNMASFAGPYLRKGVSIAVPGPVTLSEGTLIPIDVDFPSDTVARTDLEFPSTVVDIATVGGMSSGLIAANTDVREGDQLTFVTVVRVGTFGSESYVWRTYSLIVDPDDTRGTVSGDGFMLDGYYFQVQTYQSRQRLVVQPPIAGDEFIAAAAVIQSRDTVGTTSNQRSPSVLRVVQEVQDVYMTADALREALASYTDTSVDDWPVQELIGTPLRSAVTLIEASLLTGSAAGGSNVMAYVSDGGSIGLYLRKVGSDYFVLNPAGERIAATGEGASGYVKLSADGIATYVNSGLWASV